MDHCLLLRGSRICVKGPIRRQNFSLAEVMVPKGLVRLHHNMSLNAYWQLCKRNAVHLQGGVEMLPNLNYQSASSFSPINRMQQAQNLSQFSTKTTSTTTTSCCMTRSGYCSTPQLPNNKRSHQTQPPLPDVWQEVAIRRASLTGCPEQILLLRSPIKSCWRAASPKQILLLRSPITSTTMTILSQRCWRAVPSKSSSSAAQLRAQPQPCYHSVAGGCPEHILLPCCPIKAQPCSQ